jgi:hypothetical protein
MRPSFISWIQSQDSAMTGLWVARSKAFPPCCTIFCNSSKARSEFFVSRFPVGSSARITRGSFASARAIAPRCCSPLERRRVPIFLQARPLRAVALRSLLAVSDSLPSRCIGIGGGTPGVPSGVLTDCWRSGSRAWTIPVSYVMRKSALTHFSRERLLIRPEPKTSIRAHVFDADAI